MIIPENIKDVCRKIDAVLERIPASKKFFQRKLDDIVLADENLVKAIFKMQDALLQLELAAIDLQNLISELRVIAGLPTPEQFKTELEFCRRESGAVLIEREQQLA